MLIVINFVKLYLLTSTHGSCLSLSYSNNFIFCQYSFRTFTYEILSVTKCCSDCCFTVTKTCCDGFFSVTKACSDNYFGSLEPIMKILIARNFVEKLFMS